MLGDLFAISVDLEMMVKGDSNSYVLSDEPERNGILSSLVGHKTVFCLLDVFPSDEPDNAASNVLVLENLVQPRSVSQATLSSYRFSFYWRCFVTTAGRHDSIVPMSFRYVV